ncbi:MAG: hypothetical protein ACLR6J_11195 [Parabacteroides merdae]
MKRILLSAVLLLACGAVQAQFNIRVYNMSEVLKAKPIDKVLFTAQYDLSFVGDTAHEDKHIDETMMLKVGSKSSLFYSYARFRMRLAYRNGQSDRSFAGNHPGTYETRHQPSELPDIQKLSRRQTDTTRTYRRQ